MDYKKYNDYELFYMIRENDEDSKNILFKKYDPIIRKIAGNFYNNFKKYGSDYEDFYQEALIAFQNAIISYDETKNILFYTFVTFCIKRSLQSYSRNISSSKINNLIFDFIDIDEYEIEDWNSSIEKSIDYECYKNICKKVIYDLPSESSAIIELRLNGFTYREIGVLLDIPSSSVEFKSRKGRLLLRKSLHNYYCK